MAILSFSKGHSTLNVISNITKFENQRGISVGKISAGLRIRKAADSVSESAIGSKLRNEVESLKAILTSTASAKSILEIAEGGLGQISNIITRMTSLALQATNSTNTDDDRAKIDAEFQELKEEITRTAAATNFNTKRILNGGGEPNYVGKGITGVEKIKFKDDADFNTAYTITKDTTGKITIKNNSTGTTQDVTYNQDVSAGTTKDLDFDKLGIVLTLNSSYAKNTAISANGTNSAGKIVNISGDIGATAAVELEFGAQNTSTNYIVTKDAIDGVKYRSETYDFLNKTPLQKIDKLVLKAEDGSGKSITFEPVSEWKNLTVTAAATSPTIPTKKKLEDIHLMISPNKDSVFKFQVGTTFSEDNFLKVRIDSASAKDLGLDDSVGITDPDELGKVTDLLKEANSKVQNIRTKVGVIDNRLDIAIQNIQTTITNSEAAVSAIFDLDIPSEIAELSALEMKQTAAIEALARDIRAKQNLLKLF